MKTVYVIEVRTDDPVAVAAFFEAGTKAAPELVSGVHVAKNEMADWVTDVFEPPVKGGGNHYVIWNEEGAWEGWTLEHSLACRRSGEMHKCPVHRLVHVGVEAGHFLPTSPGTKLKVTLDESGVLLWH